MTKLTYYFNFFDSHLTALPPLDFYAANILLLTKTYCQL